jgi:hypothetical protein
MRRRASGTLSAEPGEHQFHQEPERVILAIYEGQDRLEDSINAAYSPLIAGMLGILPPISAIRRGFP